MAIGGGKYEKEVVEMLERLRADGVMLIVVNGDRGHGVATRGTAIGILMLPTLLRMIASDIESDTGEAWENMKVDPKDGTP